jgi:small-conductance mechanosensitive channel
MAFSSPGGAKSNKNRQRTNSIEHHAPVANFEDFGDSALLFELRFWIRYNEHTDRSAILSDIRFRIDELFTENGIVIAFPQIDVHLDGSRSSS